MRALRWLAIPPLAIGFLFLFAAVTWTEVVPLLVAAALFGVSAIIWRAFAGSWPVKVKHGS